MGFTVIHGTSPILQHGAAYVGGYANANRQAQAIENQAQAQVSTNMNNAIGQGVQQLGNIGVQYAAINALAPSPMGDFGAGGGAPSPMDPSGSGSGLLPGEVGGMPTGGPGSMPGGPEMAGQLSRQQLLGMWGLGGANAAAQAAGNGIAMQNAARNRLTLQNDTQSHQVVMQDDAQGFTTQRDETLNRYAGDRDENRHGQAMERQTSAYALRNGGTPDYFIEMGRKIDPNASDEVALGLGIQQGQQAEMKRANTLAIQRDTNRLQVRHNLEDRIEYDYSDPQKKMYADLVAEENEILFGDGYSDLTYSPGVPNKAGEAALREIQLRKNLIQPQGRIKDREPPPFWHDYVAPDQRKNYKGGKNMVSGVNPLTGKVETLFFDGNKVHREVEDQVGGSEASITKWNWPHFNGKRMEPGKIYHDEASNIYTTVDTDGGIKQMKPEEQLNPTRRPRYKGTTQRAASRTIKNARDWVTDFKSYPQHSWLFGIKPGSKGSVNADANEAVRNMTDSQIASKIFSDPRVYSTFEDGHLADFARAMIIRGGWEYDELPREVQSVLDSYHDDVQPPLPQPREQINVGGAADSKIEPKSTVEPVLGPVKVQKARDGKMYRTQYDFTQKDWIILGEA